MSSEEQTDPRSEISPDADLSHIAEDLRVLAVPIDSILLDPANAREHDEKNLAAIGGSLKRYGQRKPLVVNRADMTIEAGNGTWVAAKGLDWQHIAVVFVEDDPVTATGFAVTDNRASDLARWNQETLAALLERLEEAGEEMEVIGWSPEDMAAIAEAIASDQLRKGDIDKNAARAAKETLFTRFTVPPFTVWDSRQGYWQERKRAWIDLGIRSELGGRDNLKSTGSPSGTTPNYYKKKADKEEELGHALSHEDFQNLYLPGMLPKGTQIATTKHGGILSIFDPVVCEIVYRWFCPPGGTVLDSYAGGSVRGIVAGFLGRYYTGIELRQEQIDANEEQADRIIGHPVPDEIVTDPQTLTPVEKRGKFWFKRDDLFEVGQVRGGKARACLHLAQGARGLITAGSRWSPQVNIVANVAKHLGIPCRVHTPKGQQTLEMIAARMAGAEVIQHPGGHNTVIIRRAKDNATQYDWTYIPFGMECEATVEQTRFQVSNIPADKIERIVVPVGSGMSLAGVLWGLADRGFSVPVLGVIVGADPTARLDTYAPPDWRDRVELVRAEQDYHTPADEWEVCGVPLDSIYEAKCIPYLKPGDLLWIVCLRQTEMRSKERPMWIVGDSRNTNDLLLDDSYFDLIFTCPPYYDKERYSDDPDDLSNAQTYEDFLVAYRGIIEQSVDRLRPNRFAVYVVGDVRDGEGFLYPLIPDTIRAFRDAGMILYNSAVLVTVAGSLPIRITGQFQKMRKLGGNHQHVLVFYKGDPEAIKDWGNVDAGEPEGWPGQEDGEEDDLDGPY